MIERLGGFCKGVGSLVILLVDWMTVEQLSSISLVEIGSRYLRQYPLPLFAGKPPVCKNAVPRKRIFDYTFAYGACRDEKTNTWDFVFLTNDLEKIRSKNRIASKKAAPYESGHSPSAAPESTLS